MDLEKNWKWVVLFAVYTGIIIICTTLYTGGILYVAMLEQYPNDTAKASLVLSLNSGLLGVCAPIITLIINRTSCRFSIVTGAILLTTAGMLCAFMKSLDSILVIYGIFGGFGNAMTGVPFSIVLGFYFNKRRDFVIALSMSMVAFGMVLSAPVAMISLETYGLRGSFLIIAAINAQLCIVGVICKPSEIEKTLLKRRKKSSLEMDYNVQDGKQGQSSRESRGIEYILMSAKKKLVITWNFMPFLLSTLAWNIVYSVVFGHLPNYAAVMGETDANVTFLTTCFNAAGVAGRFSAAGIVRIGKLNNMVANIIAVGLAGMLTLIFPFFSMFIAARYTFAVLVGLCLGIPNSLATPLAIDLVGIEYLATAHGLQYLYSGLGIMVGPPIAGALYGKTGSYRNSFVLAGCIGLIGCLLAIAAKLASDRQHGQETNKQESTEQIRKDDQTLLNGDN